MNKNKDKSAAYLEGEKAFLNEKSKEYLRCFQLNHYDVISDDFVDFCNGYSRSYTKHFDEVYKINEFSHELKQLLNKYKEGIICLSGCMQGELAKIALLS